MKKVIPAQSVLIPDQAELAFKGVIYDTYHWQQTLFDGSSKTFEMLKRADTAITIGVVDDKLLVLDDDQPHRGKRVTFPGGRMDEDDKDIETAAKRETREESGYSFKNWRLIKVSQPSTKIEWFVYVYIAWNVIETEQPKLDAGEKISVSLRDLSDVKDMVMKDQGPLGEARNIFENLTSLDNLLNYPEYSGQLVDR